MLSLPAAALLRAGASTPFPLAIPSPSTGVWYLGPVPIRAYALCIILGIIAAVWLGERRWIARGGEAGQISDVALWAVPFGIVGARVYHVVTDHAIYFGADSPKSPIDAVKIWEGGLGIWGAIAGGLLGAWFAARSYRIRLLPLADALAPTLLLAQAIGRWGNYFNQELFGRPTTLPWGLRIDHRNRPAGHGESELFHPTFLYESLWNLGALGVVVWLDRRFRLGFGRVFALYVMAYTLGRGWIETLRIDPVSYNDVLGVRLNVWTSIVLFVLAAVYFVVMGRRHPGREATVFRAAPSDTPSTPDSSAAAPEDPGPGARGDAGRGDDTAAVDPADAPPRPDPTG